MTTTERNSLEQGGDQSRFIAPVETCPYSPLATVAIHTNLLAVPASDRIFAVPVSHASGIVQTESMRRISRDRSRQKRGPPVQI